MTVRPGVGVPALRGSPLFTRVLGVVHSPQATFEAVARTPRWFGVMALTVLVTAGSSAILLRTEVGQLALLDRWERMASAFGLEIDDIQYAAMEDASRHGASYAVVSALVAGPLLALGVSVALFAAFRAGRSAFTGHPAVTYRQVFAVVAHAGLILALRQVVAAPVAYVRETLASPVTIGMFFGMPNEASIPARLFGVIDLFILWWVIVLAIGMSVLSQRPAPRLAIAFVGTYLALAAALTIAMVVAGGTA